MIGWTGQGAGSAQSLPRELSLSEDRSALVQRFAPELEKLRTTTLRGAGADATAARGAVADATLRCEVVATFADVSGALTLMDDSAGSNVTISLSYDFVVVDATSLGNTHARAGPTPPARPDGSYEIHAFVDGPILEVIVNNRTALIVYVDPSTTNVGVSAPESANLRVWPLADPGHNYTMP